MAEPVMERREAIRRVVGMLGGVALVGSSGLLVACGRERSSAVPIGTFSVADITLLDEIAEGIIPATDTPGAQAAQCGAFRALMVTDAYKPEDATIFRTGLGTLDEAVRAAGGTTFMAAPAELRTRVLEALDAEQHAAMKDAPSNTPRHWFRMVKELVLTGYFTSEIGMTQALRYVEAPGRFDPCVPYVDGEKTWAPHA